MVVSMGVVNWASSTLSTEITETSSGTRQPSEWSALITPNAVRSLAQKMAVGFSAWDISRSAA